MRRSKQGKEWHGRRKETISGDVDEVAQTNESTRDPASKRVASTAAAMQCADAVCRHATRAFGVAPPKWPGPLCRAAQRNRNPVLGGPRCGGWMRAIRCPLSAACDRTSTQSCQLRRVLGGDFAQCHPILARNAPTCCSRLQIWQDNSQSIRAGSLWRHYHELSAAL